MGYGLGNFLASKEGDWNSTTLNGVQENRTHNDVHEMLTRGGNSVSTDAKGNITVNSNGQRYTWDADNMMSAADINGDQTPDVQYVMDAGNRRIAKIANGTTTVFAYADWQCVEEFENGSLKRKFAFGSYLDEPLMMASVSGASESLHFYHQNANFNIIALTDAAGTIADRIAYSSYGQIVMATNGSTGNPWFYTGQRHDADTGLDYYKMRYYDSNLGRFIGRDPIGYGDGMDLYQYVHAAPLSMNDIYGLNGGAAVALLGEIDVLIVRLVASGGTAAATAGGTAVAVPAAAATGGLIVGGAGVILFTEVIIGQAEWESQPRKLNTGNVSGEVRMPVDAELLKFHAIKNALNLELAAGKAIIAAEIARNCLCPCWPYWVKAGDRIVDILTPDPNWGRFTSHLEAAKHQKMFGLKFHVDSINISRKALGQPPLPPGVGDHLTEVRNYIRGLKSNIDSGRSCLRKSNLLCGEEAKKIMYRGFSGMEAFYKSIKDL